MIRKQRCDQQACKKKIGELKSQPASIAEQKKQQRQTKQQQPGYDAVPLAAEQSKTKGQAGVVGNQNCQRYAKSDLPRTGRPEKWEQPATNGALPL